MELALSAEQEEIRRLARDFAEREVKPRAEAIDHTREFPKDLVDKAAGLGFLGLLVPETYGGAGLDHLSFAIVIEEVARFCASTAVILDVHASVGSEPIVLYGTEEQKRRRLPDVAAGKTLTAFALTEPEAGSDAAHLKTTAARVDGGYILNGSKIFITNAGHAGTYIVMAATTPGKGAAGISAFMVDAGTAGLSVGPPLEKMGLNGSAIAEVHFDACRVPESDRLGQEGEGFTIAMRALDSGRIGISAQAIGLAQGALDDAVRYARERHQFGKPIAELQTIQNKLADMAVKIRAARWLTWQAAARCDTGQPFTKEAAMAKLFSTDIAMEVTLDALQVFGGYGYLEEYPMARRVRDAKACQIYEGTNQIQRLVIARELFKAS
ncbi:MAG TPA: acyl-CoA dehydrogenase family protein [Candidatus Limnocylindrales bacterium]|nr:acyl-CoA dehydrogenase family protein [Candidatus Limnocylindrales bacterium]